MTAEQKREIRRQQWREYYHNNKSRNAEKIKARSKEYSKNNKAILAHKNRLWREKHPYSSWSEDTKAEIRKRNRDAYWNRIDESRENHRERARKQYALNRDEIRKKNNAWAKNNRHKRRPAELKRKALKMLASINLRGIKQWIYDLKSRRFTRCYYCQEKTQNFQDSH